MRNERRVLETALPTHSRLGCEEREGLVGRGEEAKSNGKAGFVYEVIRFLIQVTVGRWEGRRIERSPCARAFLLWR